MKPVIFAEADYTPVDEQYRLAVLHSLALLDTPAEAEFDSLVELTKQVFDCPIALVSLVDDDRQWFKARCGLDASQTPRDVAFCAHAIRSTEIMVVPDATLDPRFVDNALVTGAPHVRFYAGIPLFVPGANGGAEVPVGTLCVIDTQPRTLDDAQLAQLASFGRVAEALIRGRTSVSRAVRHAEQRDAAAAKLKRRNRQLAQAERMAGVGSWRWHICDDRLEWSDQVFAIHDLPAGRVPKLERALSFFPPSARETLVSALQRTRQTGAPCDVEVDFVSATGVKRRVRSIGELELVDGVAVALIGVFQDVTAKFQLEQILRRSANQDALTGIANRAGFDIALDDALIEAEAERSPLALMLIDLDGFKRINDVHGHIAGDELLQGVARRLEMPYLQGCTAARLGGDEFALILTRPAHCAGVHELGERVIEALGRPIDIDSGRVAVAGSIGICAFEPGLTRRELIRRADVALYAAKNAGKGVARAWENPPAYAGPERRAAR